MRAISKRMSEVLGAHCPSPTSRQIDEPLQEGCVIEIEDLLVDLSSDLGGAVVFTRGAQCVSQTGTYDLDIIYGLSPDGYNIFQRNNMYSGRIPDKTYTFGESPAGDQFCIAKATGAVHYWAHDAAGVDRGYVLISSSLEDFLNRLTPNETSDSEALEKSKKIVSIDLSF
ncbi:SMI1/KNR4 family protein [Pseudomonas sp. W5-36]|uniref:SMI1/KNR4 family protein n=1 Tax=Pseudomonas sp. W5-36 TaxID=3097455 RepID=UPI00397A03CF